MTKRYFPVNNPFDYLNRQLNRLLQGRLWLKVLVGLFLGIATGMLIGPTGGWLTISTSTTLGNWLALPGQLFLTLIQMIVIPLIFASVVRGLSASESFEQLQRMGVGVVVYFVGTTVIAIIIGLAVASLIKPGDYVDSTSLKNLIPTGSSAETITVLPPGSPPSLSELPDKLVTILPSNPLTSMVEGQMLQVVIFAMIMGVALVMMKPAQSKPLLDLMSSLQEVCMTVVGWAMRLAPLAVFGLMAQLTSKIGLDAILGMGVYVGTVLIGLLVLLSLYLVLIFLFSRQHPASFMRDTRDVLLLAFSTSSSAAVMPLSIKTAEEKLQVHPSVSQFVIPLGATINMNGTALYQGVATVFLAQVFAVDLSTGALLLVIVTAVGASIGSPGTPGVGIVILAMVLETVGIPVAGIVLIMGVDRILDMSRTAVNVCGDLVAAKLMNRWMVKTELLQATNETNKSGAE